MRDRDKQGGNVVGPKREEAISDRHRLLVDHYFATGFDKTEAARRAGFSESSARGYIGRLFRHPDIVQEIDRRMEIYRKRYDLNEDWVIQRLMRMADVSMGDILQKLNDNDNDLMALTPDERYAISEIVQETRYEQDGDEKIPVTKLKVKAEAKLGFLVALARKLGLFNDSLELKGELTLRENMEKGRDRLRKRVADGVTVEPAKEPAASG